MSKLIRNRWLHWPLFVAALIALGAGTYQIQPPAPMCEIEGPHWPHGFLGSDHLITLPPAVHMVFDPNAVGKAEGFSFTPGPLTIWDTHSGAEVARYFDDGRKFGEMMLVKNNRIFVAVTIDVDQNEKTNSIKKTSLVLADLATGKTIDVPLAKDAIDYFHFIPSSDGEYIAHIGRLRAPPHSPSLAVYETSTGRVVLERESEFATVEICDAELLLFDAAKKALEVWKLRDGQLAGSLEQIDPPQSSRGSPYVVAARLTPNQQDTVTWVIWNRKTHRVEGEFEADDILLKDGKRLLAVRTVKDAQVLELRELPTGRLLGQLPGDATLQCNWSVDGRLLAVHSEQPKPVLRLIDLTTMKTLWQHGDCVLACSIIGYSRDWKTVFIYENDLHEFVAYDCQTGKPRLRISVETMPLPWNTIRDCPNMVLQYEQVQMPALHNFLWKLGLRINPVTEHLVVFDAESCRTLFHWSGPAPLSVRLSDDGRVLATFHVEEGQPERGCVLRCWDVDARKPLRWAVGVPAGLGVMGVLWSWRQGRRGKTPPIVVL